MCPALTRSDLSTHYPSPWSCQGAGPRRGDEGEELSLGPGGRRHEGSLVDWLLGLMSGWLSTMPDPHFSLSFSTAGSHLWKHCGLDTEPPASRAAVVVEPVSQKEERTLRELA